MAAIISGSEILKKQFDGYQDYHNELPACNKLHHRALLQLDIQPQVESRMVHHPTPRQQQCLCISWSHQAYWECCIHNRNERVERTFHNATNLNFLLRANYNNVCTLLLSLRHDTHKASCDEQIVLFLTSTLVCTQPCGVSQAIQVVLSLYTNKLYVFGKGNSFKFDYCWWYERKDISTLAQDEHCLTGQSIQGHSHVACGVRRIQKSVDFLTLDGMELELTSQMFHQDLSLHKTTKSQKCHSLWKNLDFNLGVNFQLFLSHSLKWPNLLHHKYLTFF